MRLKKGWALTELSGDYVAIPTGESARSFAGIVRLNESARDIWEGLANGLSEDAIIEKMIELYEGIDREKAQNAVKSVIDKLKSEGLLEE